MGLQNQHSGKNHYAFRVQDKGIGKVDKTYLCAKA